MSTPGDFDNGPLTWVKREIDQALERSLIALRAYASNPGDSNQIRFSQTHFHQAHGALQIVGLDGVTRLSEELDGLLGDIVKAGEAPKPEVVAAAEHAFAAPSGSPLPGERARPNPLGSPGASGGLRRIESRGWGRSAPNTSGAVGAGIAGNIGAAPTCRMGMRRSAGALSGTEAERRGQVDVANRGPHEARSHG